MNNPELFKTFLAGAAILPYRIVSFGADDNHAVQSAAGAGLHFGLTQELGAEAAEEPVDILMSGVGEVTYGGNVTRGQPLTSDATGRAVLAVATNRVIGYAMVSGVVGDIGSVLIAPGTQP